MFVIWHISNNAFLITPPLLSQWSTARVVDRLFCQHCDYHSVLICTTLADNRGTAPRKFNGELTQMSHVM